jgi:hypothetical protein
LEANLLILNRWTIVAGRWERYLANAALVAAVFAFMAWLMFPPFATASGWAWKVLAIAAVGLTAAAAQAVAARPASRIFAEALTGLNRVQRAQVLKALRGKTIPTDPAVLATAIRVGAIGQAYHQRYTQKQKIWRFVLPAIYVVIAALQLIGHSGAHQIHQALMWLALAVYFGAYFVWIAHRGRQLDRAQSQLREAAIDIPVAASVAAQTSSPTEIPPQRIWASLLFVGVIAVGFAGAIWAWGPPFPDPRARACDTVGGLVKFMSVHEDMLDATKISTGTPALSEYEQWSKGLQSYAAKASDPALAGHLQKVVELSAHAVAVVHDLRSNPLTNSNEAIRAHETDYHNTISKLMDEEKSAVTSCTDSR